MSKVHPVPPAFAAAERIKPDDYARRYAESLRDPDSFWAEAAKRLDWIKFPARIKDVSYDPKDLHIRWYADGVLNPTASCLDRHLATRGDKTALLFEGDDPNVSRKLSYRELHAEVCRFANALKHLGVNKGDRIAIYMPMIPEACVAMLACARIGAIHSVVFGGFSPDALAGRIADSQCKLVITADEGVRANKKIPLKANVDEALTRPDTASIETVVVVRRTGGAVNMQSPRDRWWDALVDGQSTECAPEPMNAEDPLFILYTSGSTGKPKGVLHTTAGYLAGTHLTSKYVFDLRPDDVYFCTADVGWITGHSYIVYGPLSNGATCLMYEGAPNTPDWGRFWQIIEKHKVSILYTAPTAIRAFIRAGNEWPAKYDLSSLRLLGSVGEPINPEAWIWYYEHIGQKRCPIVDTWWQTETGAIMLTTLPGAHTMKPGVAGLPFFGVSPAVVSADGQSVGADQGGFLVMQKPWPSMLRTVWGDDERYRAQYWSDVQGAYFTGDGAYRDKDGYIRVVGRVDDVLNVSGHRIGTAEIESALVSHKAVAEAAAVGRPDEMKGQALVVFVTLKPAFAGDDGMKKALGEHVAQEIGKFARPDEIRFAEGLPKTRSGKIMRRLLKDVAAGRATSGDTSTLEDLNVLAKLSSNEE